MVTIFIRTVIIYLTLIFCMRLMGKRQIGELEVSELVTTLLISELASLPITDNNIPLSHAIIPIITLLTFEVVASYLLAYFPTLKNILSARPTVLINKGKLDRKAMLSSRISADELISELRQKGVTELKEVQYAILEQNGKITVIQKAKYKQPTLAQMGIKEKETGISHIAVCEGKINEDTLSRLSLTKHDIIKQAHSQGNNLEDIYIMMVNDANEFETVKRKDKE